MPSDAIEPPFNSAIDRAAEIIAIEALRPDRWSTDIAKALAAADPPLLITPEIQAVLDAAVNEYENRTFNRHPLLKATSTYLASRGEK